ncbi:MAG TPA: hypothetical protein VG298_17825, partial [Acidimicrobiales bacterium]|nr:hypothetical protein [Acidimicrobiales bacterium]
DSDIALGQPLTAAGPPDLTVRRVDAEGPFGDDEPGGERIAQLALGERRFYTGTDNGAHYVLRIHGICDFLVDRSLSTIECRAQPSAEAELLSLLVRGGLLAFVLGLRGACVLHASVVETDGGSVAFVGGSGQGKSTLAALTCRDGARFVSDDLLRLDEEVRPSWVGCSSELRLRPAAAPMAEGEPWEARQTMDERVALRPPRSVGAVGLLGAVVVPAPTRESTELTVTRIEPLAATFALSAFPRLMWELPAVLATQFAGVARLADAVPLYRASVPWGPPFAAGLGADLLSAVLQS